MLTGNNTQFIELRNAWGNFAIKQSNIENRKRFVKGNFNIGIMRKINKRKVLAITLVILNTPLPTMSAVTNIIVYKKVMNFNLGKLGRKINLIKVKFR